MLERVSRVRCGKPSPQHLELLGGLLLPIFSAVAEAVELEVKDARVRLTSA
jgi:hypothetical protein